MALIDFKYVPPNPDPITGQSALEQTERAINELGIFIEEAVDTSDEALRIANEAKVTANDALTEAQDASTKADNAQNAADAAQATANDASAAANDAVDQSNNALDVAAQANTTAEAANATANTANATANTALSTANTADSIANTALSTANAAAQAAADADGIFYVNASQVDANTYFDATTKLFLTNADTANPNLNFPSGMATPYWFMVYITDNGQFVTQTCWDDLSASIYTRVGQVNLSDPDNPIVTWAPWHTVATPTVIKSVSVQVDPAGQPAGTYLAIVMDTASGDQTEYINLSQMIGAGYTSGNGMISISADNKISGVLTQTSINNGLTITPSGLNMALAVPSQYASNPGTPGVVYLSGVSVNVSQGNYALTAKAVYDSIQTATFAVPNNPISKDLVPATPDPDSGAIARPIQQILNTARSNLGYLLSLFDGSGRALKAQTAEALMTGRTVRNNAFTASTAVIFDGTSDITLGIPVAVPADTESDVLPVTTTRPLGLWLQTIRSNVLYAVNRVTEALLRSNATALTQIPAITTADQWAAIISAIPTYSTKVIFASVTSGILSGANVPPSAGAVFIINKFGPDRLCAVIAYASTGANKAQYSTSSIDGLTGWDFTKNL